MFLTETTIHDPECPHPITGYRHTGTVDWTDDPNAVESILTPPKGFVMLAASYEMDVFSRSFSFCVDYGKGG